MLPKCCLAWYGATPACKCWSALRVRISSVIRSCAVVGLQNRRLVTYFSFSAGVNLLC
jgi:hypothetical protein